MFSWCHLGGNWKTVKPISQCGYMGRPLPLPRPPPPSCSAFGFLIVSSTERMRQAASLAAVMALILTTAGSHTHATMLSAISSVKMSTPYQVPPKTQQYTSLGVGLNLSMGFNRGFPHLWRVSVAVCWGCWWRRSRRCRTVVEEWPREREPSLRSAAAPCPESFASSRAGAYLPPSQSRRHLASENKIIF